MMSQPTKQTARKSTTRPIPDNQRRDNNIVLRAKPLCRPDKDGQGSSQVDDDETRKIMGPIAKSYLSARQRFNQMSQNRPNWGIGTGKGGIKRLAKVMKHRKNRAPTRFVLSDIRREERRREYSIPLIQITRLIKELIHDICRGESYWQDGPAKIQIAAIAAIRDAAEGQMVHFFELCSFLVTHGRRVTLLPKDLALASRLKRWSALTGGL